MCCKWLTAIVVLMSTNVLGHTYQARLDEAVWHLEPSALKCRLWQAVPNYGDAVFEVNAGEPLKFYLDVYRPLIHKGNAELAIVAPEWRSDLAPKTLAKITVKAGKRPLELAEDLASHMLSELQVGMYPSITHGGWAKSNSVTVGISAVNFINAYNGYVSCVAGLFPTNYNELQQSFMHFAVNKYGIRGATKERLDLIAGYVSIDPSVSKIYVDGHTDSDGRRGHNWELSRLRANAVKEYLEKKGVLPEMIVMNYHGEGRPMKKNTTKSNKAINRRVLVRMIR